MRSMRQKLPWLFLLVWAIVFGIFIELRWRAAAMLMPLVLLGGIIYLVFLTAKMWPRGEKTENKQNAENATAEKQTNEQSS